MAEIKKLLLSVAKKSYTEVIGTDITCTKIYTSEAGKSPTCFGTSYVYASDIIGISLPVLMYRCFCPLIVQRNSATEKPPY